MPNPSSTNLPSHAPRQLLTIGTRISTSCFPISPVAASVVAPAAIGEMVSAPAPPTIASTPFTSAASFRSSSSGIYASTIRNRQCSLSTPPHPPPPAADHPRSPGRFHKAGDTTPMMPNAHPARFNHATISMIRLPSRSRPCCRIQTENASATPPAADNPAPAPAHCARLWAAICIVRSPSIIASNLTL